MNYMTYEGILTRNTTSPSSEICSLPKNWRDGDQMGWGSQTQQLVRATFFSHSWLCVATSVIEHLRNFPVSKFPVSKGQKMPWLPSLLRIHMPWIDKHYCCIDSHVSTYCARGESHLFCCSPLNASVSMNPTALTFLDFGAKRCHNII